MNAAKSVRLAREKHPERYCSECLWNLSGGPCPRHTSIMDRRKMLLAQGRCPGCWQKSPWHSYYCREGSTAKLPAVRKRCQKCGDYEDVVGDESTCTTFEKDAGNPFGKIPIYGVHEWGKE